MGKKEESKIEKKNDQRQKVGQKPEKKRNRNRDKIRRKTIARITLHQKKMFPQSEPEMTYSLFEPK